MCLSACKDQINHVAVTSSDFPNRETFVRRDEFCLTVAKLWRTCESKKKVFLEAKFPKVCKALAKVKERAQPAGVSVCGSDLRWDPIRLWGFSPTDADVINLEEIVFQYAKHNLAVVNVYIKDPVVTSIQRDQKIPIIGFVANTGGLLGLCMGFSLVSVFELLYHMLGAVHRFWDGLLKGSEAIAAAVASSRGGGNLAHAAAGVAVTTAGSLTAARDCAGGTADINGLSPSRRRLGAEAINIETDATPITSVTFKLTDDCEIVSHAVPPTDSDVIPGQDYRKVNKGGSGSPKRKERLL